MTHRWRAAALTLPLLFAAAPAALAQGAPAAASAPTDAASTAPAAAPARAATPTTATPVIAPTPTAAPADAGPSTAPLNLPHDLSPGSMFLHADVVVKAVMVGLLLASVATWTVGLGKAAQLLGARARARAGLRALAGADGLDTVGAAAGPVAALLAAARDEAARSAGLPTDGVKERAALSLARVEARAARAMAAGTGLLATVGSVAPFVGLFGTVWGIMNSFVGISQAHTSNLAVVAPGIAEALLATAVGLVAAIPAVVIFNGFARATSGYRALLADASAEVMRHLSRDLDRGPALRRRAAE